MPAEPQNPAQVDCRTPEGRVLARILIWPRRDSNELTGDAHPLIRWLDIEAQARSEEPVQLRERERYFYRLQPLAGAPNDLILLESRGITRSPAAAGGADEGFIEPGDQCGVLPLITARARDPAPLARAAVEVRSVKLDYREHYRGMLNYIAEQSAGLLLDSRAPTRFRLSFEWRTSRAMLEQQLEFLRHTLEAPSFRGAVDEILRNPHRTEKIRLEPASETVSQHGRRCLAPLERNRLRPAIVDGSVELGNLLQPINFGSYGLKMRRERLTSFEPRALSLHLLPLFRLRCEAQANRLVMNPSKDCRQVRNRW